MLRIKGICGNAKKGGAEIMTNLVRDYVLGHNADAARRLAIQDAQFADESETLLDCLNISRNDRVVELGAGAGRFSRRILKRLGRGGTLIAVDFTPALLEQAKEYVAGVSEAEFVPVVADISKLGDWLFGANVVVGRTVVHHLPLAESWLGRLRAKLQPKTRIGFVEPEFRALLGRFSALEAEGQTNLAVLRRWAEGIVRFYQGCGLSPEVGASLCWSLSAAGFQDVIVNSSECLTDATVVENLLLYYDEIRERYIQMEIMTGAEIDEQQRLLRELPQMKLPAVWGIYRATATV
jgi:SAM-dependent methyltransferase